MDWRHALIDTGARVSAIKTAVAREIGLVETSHTEIGTATGPFTVPVCIGNLQLSAETAIIPNVEFHVAGFDPPEFDIVIGMDVLGRGCLTVDGRTRRFSFSWDE